VLRVVLCTARRGKENVRGREHEANATVQRRRALRRTQTAGRVQGRVRPADGRVQGAGAGVVHQNGAAGGGQDLFGADP